MSGSLESMRGNAGVHRLDLRESEPVVTPRKPLYKSQRSVEPVTLHHAGQRAQHITV